MTLEDIGQLIRQFELTLYEQDPPRFCTKEEFTAIFKKKSDSGHIDAFIAGLMLNKNNVASLQSAAYSAYKGDRIIHKPILSLTIDDTECVLAGFYSYHEALNTFFQNNITLGKIPAEWEEIPLMRDLKKEFKSRHKDILENPVEDLLKQKNIKHDRNIITLLSREHKNNISINKTPGEIDFIFLLDNTIFIADCKNLTKRYEMHGYYQDISKFTPYETKMTEKLEFFRKHHVHLQEHLEVKFSDREMNLQDYKIEGIFIINTPTIPMINGKYKIYSFHNFQNLLDGDDYFEEKIIMPDKYKTEIGWPFINTYKSYLKSRG